MIEWLTSLQGILIVSGVLLLIIATIIFFASNKKGSYNLEEDIVGEDASPVEDDIVKIDVKDTVQQEVNTNIEEPIVPSVELNVVEPVIEEAKVENINSDNNEFVEPVAFDVPPVISIDSLESEEPIVPQEKKVTIYGGNDPLEATQSIPKMEANHTLYGVSKDEIVFDFPKASEVEKEEL